nr:hypothetical protein E2R29_27010 [Burkholderia pseudomallei]
MLVLANRAVGQSYRNHIAISVMPSVIGRLSTRNAQQKKCGPAFEGPHPILQNHKAKTFLD